MSRRTGTVLAAVVWLVLGAGSPAGAGGGRLAPVADRYEPGSTATLVGYTGGPAPADTFYAYLRPADDGSRPALDDSGIYVGELVVEESGRAGYLALRVSLTFDLPEALPAGDYEVTYCDDPCTGVFLGDLVPSPVSIGVDPVRPIVREWAPDEPEIANLAPAALLVGPGFQTTAGALRAPPSTAAPAPVATTVPATVAPPPAPVPASVDGDMAWPVPTALVIASAAGTALWLSGRQRRAASRRPAVPAAGRAGAYAGSGRG